MSASQSGRVKAQARHNALMVATYCCSAFAVATRELVHAQVALVFNAYNSSSAHSISIIL